MAIPRLILRLTPLMVCLLLNCGRFQQASSLTRLSDVEAMNALAKEWTSTARTLNWHGDPCWIPWQGVTCDAGNSTVTELILAARDLQGAIPPAIGGLQGLTMLDLSLNAKLIGTLPPQLGDLENLQTLNLQYCNLNGSLPSELGNLHQLSYMFLNGNTFTGSIPAELGNTNLTWMDISYNQIGGNISLASNSPNSLGLDNLTTIKHFHFNNNNLTGPFPKEFLSLPNLVHLLLENNQLRGAFPNVQNISKSLEIMRVDFNLLEGGIPTAFETATSITDLNFRSNRFSGPLPNFSALTNLRMLDLSENNFDTPDSFPSWITSMQGIKALNLAGLKLSGSVPSGVFNLPNLESVNLSSNSLNDSLTFSGVIANGLTQLDLDNNDISGFSGDPGPNVTLTLQNNPVCQSRFFNSTPPCIGNNVVPGVQKYVHVPTKCVIDCDNGNCGDGKQLNPYTCKWAYPLELTLTLVAPPFHNVDNAAMQLEGELSSALNLSRDQSYIPSMNYDSTNSRADVMFWVFPSSDGFLSPSVGHTVIFQLGQRLFDVTAGPYTLSGYKYAKASESHRITEMIAIILGCSVGALLVGASIFVAIFQKLRADRAVLSNPFASWRQSSAAFGEAPQLKGARWFSLAELKAYTNNWSQDNLLGEGGYGNVYRGLLTNNEPVAIKRAKEGSKQGAHEFKTEIELLSRVHHQNLVGLVGFCYEGGEQALVYEFMSNGTLSDQLHGGKNVPLTWNLRREIALDTARGLSYLHNHANPPIIHRDIKTANILLDETLVGKLADFGISKLVPSNFGEHALYSEDVRGTLGYVDPEYYMTQNLTFKSDIYSFGVVLLELLTARAPLVGGQYVVRDMRNALAKGGIVAVRPLLDPLLKDLSVKELELYLEIAVSCVEDNGENRPTAAEIVKQLEDLDVYIRPKSMEIGRGKRVKFFDDFITESDDAVLLANQYPQARKDFFKYSGSFGKSRTVIPK